MDDTEKRELIAKLRGEKVDFVGEIDLKLLAADALEETLWRDIESAPMDGTVFVGFQESGDPDTYECRWYDNWGAGGFWMDNADTEPTPTHWKPLDTPE